MAIFSFEAIGPYAADSQTTLEKLIGNARNDVEDKRSFSTLSSASSNKGLRTIRSDVGMLLGSTIGKRQESVLLLTRTPNVKTANTIDDLKDSEHAASAFGKQEKIYNLLEAISNHKDSFPDGNSSQFSKIETELGNKDASGKDALFHVALHWKTTPTNSALAGTIDSDDISAAYGTYFGYLNKILEDIRAIPLQRLTKPAVVDATSALSVLYAVTQAGSRSWNTTLLTTIAGANPEGEITDAWAENILRSNACFIDTVVGDPDKIDTTTSKSNGTLLEQWKYLTGPEGLLQINDTNGSTAKKLKEAFEATKKSMSMLKPEALRKIYTHLIPITPILDAQSEASIRSIASSNDKSLQEYFSYLMSGLATSGEESTVLPKIQVVCDEISTLAKNVEQPPCCLKSYEALNEVTKELYRSSIIFQDAAINFENAPAEIDAKIVVDAEALKDLSFDISSNIQSILTLEKPESKPGSTPESTCFSENTVASLTEIKEKLYTANENMKAFFGLPLGVDDSKYKAALIDNPQESDFCQAIQRILCGAPDDFSNGHSVPFLLENIKKSLDTIRGNLSEKKNIMGGLDLINLHLFVEKIFKDFEAIQKTLNDDFPTNDLGEKCLPICSTPDTEGKVSPCSSITTEKILDSLKGFPPIKEKLSVAIEGSLRYLDCVTHNPVHVDISYSLFKMESSLNALVAFEPFEKICVQASFRDLLKKIDETCKKYPDLSRKNYLYDSNLLKGFKDFKDSLSGSTQAFSDFLREYTNKPEEKYTPDYAISTETLWQGLAEALTRITKTIEKVKLIKTNKIPIAKIYDDLGSIENSLNTINGINGKKLFRDYFAPADLPTPADPSSLSVPSINFADLTSAISGLRPIFQPTNCCAKFEEHASKLSSVLWRLSNQKMSSNDLTNDFWTRLIGSIKQSRDGFSDNLDLSTFLETTSSAVEQYLESFYQHFGINESTTKIQAPLTISTDQQGCEGFIKHVRAMSGSLEIMLESFHELQKNFNPLSYNDSHAQKIRDIIQFFQDFEFWFKTKFLPALTNQKTPLDLGDLPSQTPTNCSAFCAICNSNIWGIEGGILYIGGNITDSLEAFRVVWNEFPTTFQAILHILEERKCNDFASALCRYSQQINWLGQNIISLRDIINTPENLDPFSKSLVSKILQWKASSSSSPPKKLESALNLFLNFFSETIGNSFTEQPLITITQGHEQIESISESLKDSFQFLLTTMRQIIPEASQHFNYGAYQGLQFLGEMLQEMQTLTLGLKTDEALSVECELCRSLAIQKMKENSFEDLTHTLTAIQDSLNHPLCPRKLTHVLFELQNALINFVKDPEKIGEVPENLGNLLMILQSEKRCKADELAEALEPLIQIFDPGFTLPEEIKDFTAEDAESFLNQAFKSISLFPSVLKKIAETTKSGNLIPDWFDRFEKLCQALNIFTGLTEAKIYPACEHKMYESLKDIFLDFNMTELLKNFQTQINEVRKAAHAHPYTESIRGLCENAQNLQSKIEKITETTNSYEWFNENFHSISKNFLKVSTGKIIEGGATFEPESFFERCQNLVKALNDAIIIEAEKHTILPADKADHATIGEQLKKTGQCLTTIRHSLTSMTEQDSWKGLRQANLLLAEFMTDASNFVGELLKEFTSCQEESFALPCDYCGELNCSEFMTLQNAELIALKSTLDKLSKIANTCFDCRELFVDLKTLAENTYNIAEIVKNIASRHEPIDPEKIQKIIGATESKIFSPTSPIQCTSAKGSIEKLNALASAFLDILKTTYMGDSYPETSRDLTIPDDASCSELFPLAESIFQSFSEIGVHVQTIAYNSAAPPLFTWAQLSKDSLTLSDFVRKVLACLSGTIEATNICPTCNSDNFLPYFSNLLNTIFPAINREIHFLQDNWNTFEFSKEITTILTSIQKFHLLTKAMGQWFANDHELAEILKVNQAWISFIKQLKSSNFDTIFEKEKINLAHLINYQESILLQESSYENLECSLETLSLISDQNFSILSLIKQSLSQKIRYLDPDLVCFCRETANIWRTFSEQFKDLSFQIGSQTFALSNDFYASWVNASHEWLDLAETLQAKEPCCRKKLETLKDIVLDFCALEQEFSSLAKIQKVTSLEALDLSSTSDSLTELSDFIQETIPKKTDCTEISDLAALSKKLNLFQQSFFSIRRTLNPEDSLPLISNIPVDFYLSNETSPCNSTTLFLQRISHTFEEMQKVMEVLHDSSVQSQDLTWSQDNVKNLKTIIQTLQKLSQNITPFFHHWACSFCSQHDYASFAKQSKSSLESINILNCSLYDNITLRCCNERAIQSAAITERIYNLMHAMGNMLETSSLFVSPNPDLIRKLFQIGTLLDSNFSVLTDWLSNDPHTPTTSTGIDNFLSDLSSLLEGSSYPKKSIHFNNLLGCEIIDLCWEYTGEAFEDLTSSFSSLYSIVTSGKRILPGSAEKLSLQKIATFFNRLSETLKDYSMICLRCSQNQGIYVASACSEITRIINNLCKVEPTCCNSLEQTVKTLAQIAFESEYYVQVINEGSPEKILGDRTLQFIFNDNPLPAVATFEEKFIAIRKILNEFAQGYELSLTVPTFQNFNFLSCDNIQNYISEYKKSFTNIYALLGNLEKNYLKKPSLSINLENAQNLQNIASYLSFLDVSPFSESCNDCKRVGIIECQIQKFDPFFLNGPVEAIVESLANKCCVEESKLFHRIFYALRNLTSTLRKANTSDILVMANDPSQDHLWETLTDSIQETITDINQTDSTFKAHQNAESDQSFLNPEEGPQNNEATQPDFLLKRFTQKIEIISQKLNPCLNVFPDPFEILLKVHYSCEQKVTDILNINDKMGELINEFSRLTAELQNIKTEYAKNHSILGTFDSFYSLSLALQTKIEASEISLCVPCGLLMQKKPAYAFLMPTLMDLSISIKSFSTLLLKPTCCETKTQKLLTLINQVEKLNHTTLALSSLWRDGVYPTLTQKTGLETNLVSIVNSLKGVKKTIADNTQNGFENVIEKIISDNRINAITDSFKDLYRLYTSKEVENLDASMQDYQDTDPCQRLYLTFIKLTDLSTNISQNLGSLIQFWQKNPPAYSSVVAEKLASIKEETVKLQESVSSLLSEKFGHFSICDSCQIPLNSEIVVFEKTLSNQTIVSIQDFFSQFRCGNEFKSRKDLFSALRKLNISLQYFVNHPILDRELPLTMYKKNGGGQLISQTENVTVNITHTTDLNPFFKTWIHAFMEFTKIIETKQNLFEKIAGSESLKIESMTSHINTMSAQLISAYQALGGIAPKEDPILLTILSYSCDSNCAIQEDIASTFLELYGSLSQGSRWYLAQPYAYNDFIGSVVFFTNRFLGSLDSMLQVPKSPCALCYPAQQASYNQIRYYIAQSIAESQLFLSAVSIPKCSKNIVNALDQFSIALKSSADQFALCLPLPNDGDQYEIYKNKLSTTLEKVKNINQALQDFHIDFSCLIASLCEKQNDSFACIAEASSLSQAPTVLSQLESLTLTLKNAVNPKILELAQSLSSGILPPTTVDILDAQSMFDHEKIELIYTRITAYLTQVADNFQQLRQDFKYVAEKDRSPEKINIFEYSPESIESLESLEKTLKGIQQQLQKLITSPLPLHNNLPTLNNNLSLQQMDASLSKNIQSVQDANLVLRDRAWTSIVPGLQNLITRISSVQEILSSFCSGEKIEIHTSLFKTLTPLLTEISKALCIQKESFKIQNPKDLTFEEQIIEYNNILNQYQENDLINSLKNLKTALQIYTNEAQPRLSFSKNSTFSERCKENVELIFPFLEKMKQALSSIQTSLSIDETGNKILQKELDNIATNVSELAEQMDLFFCAIDSVFQANSSDYPQHLKEQGAKIKEKTKPISVEIQAIASLFGTAKCCNGLSAAYHDAAKEVYYLKQRIGYIAKNFKIDSFFNAITHQELSTIENLLKDLCFNVYHAREDDLSECFALKIKESIVTSKESAAPSLLKSLTNLCPQEFSPEEFNVAISNKKSSCENLAIEQNLFKEQIKDLVSEFQLFIQWVQTLGIEPIQDFTSINETIDDVFRIQSILEAIYGSQLSTCQSCLKNNDKKFLKDIIQSMATLHSHLTSFKDVVSEFCCPQSIGAILAKTYGFIEYLAQQMQNLTQRPFDMNAINSEFEQLIQFASACYEPLKNCIGTTLHQIDQVTVFEAFETILDSFNIGSSPVYNIVPFNQQTIALYCENIVDSLNTLPSSMAILKEKMQTSDYALYPTLLRNIQYFKSLLKKTCELFENPKATPVLIHSTIEAPKTQIAILRTLQAFEDEVMGLYETASNAPKEKMIIQQTAKVSQVFKTLVCALNLFQKSISSEVEFGTPSQNVLRILKGLIQAFPDLAPIAKTWNAISTQEPIESFTDLKQELVLQEASLESIAQLILDLAAMYGNTDNLSLTSETNSDLSFKQLLLEIQHSVLSVLDQFVTISNSIKNKETRRFHAEIITFLKEGFSSGIQKWGASFTSLATTLAAPLPIAYDGFEYAQILNDIASALDSVSKESQEIAKNLEAKESSKQAEFMVSLAERVEGLTQGIQATIPDSTLDQAEDFLKQIALLSHNLVQTVLSSQACLPHSAEQEQSRPDYLSGIEKLLEATQNAFSVPVMFITGLETNFDETTLELAKERINSSLKTCVETFEILQTQWLAQPYILRADLIQACTDIMEELKKITSESLEKFFEQMTSFVERLRQPTCCQAVNALTNSIENDLACFAKNCGQIFGNDLIILSESSYQKLLSDVTAIANGLYLEDNIEGTNTSVCYHLDLIQDANCQNESYLASLSEIKKQTAQILQKSSDIAISLGITPQTLSFEPVLQGYCQDQTSSLIKMADHFEQIHTIFDHFATTFVPTTGIARPYRFKLIQLLNGAVDLSVKKFGTSLSTFKDRLMLSQLCVTCDSVSTIESLDKVLEKCALISTDIKKMATAFEAFRYSQISQTMHEVTQAHIYLEVLTQEIVGSDFSVLLSTLKTRVESVHDALKTLILSWDTLFLDTESSKDPLNYVHTLLKSIKTCYQTWIEQLSLIRQKMSLPEIAQPALDLDEPYTEILVQKDCTLIIDHSEKIIKNLGSLYQKFWTKRFADDLSAKLFQEVHDFFKKLLDEKTALQNKMTGTPSLIIQSFIPDDSVLPLLNHFTFLLSHTRCCEDYIEKIETGCSKFESIQSQIASLISMTPFISPASDAQATLIANFLHDPLPEKNSVFTLLGKLELTLESFLQLAKKDKDYLCFGVADQDKSVAKGLDSILLSLNEISNQFQEISRFFQTVPTEQPIQWDILLDQLNTSNIYVDTNIATAWDSINQKLVQLGKQVEMILPHVKMKNGLCILNDVDGHLSQSLQRFNNLSSLAISSASSLKTYQARCCSANSNQLGTLVPYIAPLKSIQKFDFTLQEMNDSKISLNKISNSLGIIAANAMNLQGLSCHSRAFSDVLDQMKPPLLLISDLLSTDNTIVSVEQKPESCESFTQHLIELNNCLSGENSLSNELKIWETNIRQDSGSLGGKERCYDQNAITIAQRLIGALSSLHATFRRLIETPPIELCETCSEPYPYTAFQTLAQTFHGMEQTMSRINELLKTPTCCYESQEQFKRMYQELSTLGSVFLSCPTSENELITDAAIAEEIANHLQKTTLLLDHKPETSPLFDSYCCSKQWAEKVNPFFNQFLFPAFSEIKASLLLLGGTPAVEPIPLIFVPDPCQNTLSTAIQVGAILKKIAQKMNDFKKHVSNFDSDFYSQPFIDTLKMLLQAGENTRKCLDVPSCFCSGCSRSFLSYPEMNVEKVRIDSMQSISKTLQDFEISLQIMETRWCRKQAIAFHTFVNATEKLSQRVIPLIQANLDDFKKETAQKIGAWLKKMSQTHLQINSILSANTLNWHHSSETVSFFETLTSSIDAIIPISQDLLNALSIPFSDTIRGFSSYDADQILSDWDWLILVLNKVSSQFLNRTFLPRTDHLAIIPEWKEMTQSLALLSTHTKNLESCDCSFCQNLPVTSWGNALLALCERQESFVAQLENVHCCEPILSVLIALDEPIYQLAQAFQIIQSVAIYNLTEEQNTRVSFLCDAIVHKITTLDSALNAFLSLKDLDQDLICSALKIAENPATQALKNEMGELKETIISALVVFDSTLPETLNLASAQRLNGMTCELLLGTIVEDLGALNTSMNQTWERFNACPVRDIYPASLEAFNAVKTALDEFYHHFNPQILCLMNPCEKYDNYENRQIISKIPAIITKIQTNLGKEYNEIHAMCCSRVAYKTDAIFYQIGDIKQVLEAISHQGADAIKTFIESPALLQLANTINPRLEAMEKTWDTIFKTLTTPSDNYCKVSSIHTHLDGLADILNTVVSGFNNDSKIPLAPFNPSKIYRCHSFSEVLTDGANLIESLNPILKKMNTAVNTSAISYQKAFPFYNMCLNFKENLSTLKTFLTNLQNARNDDNFCPYCEELPPIISKKLPPELGLIILHLDDLIINCHKACDLDVAKLLFQRNRYLSQLALLPTEWLREAETFWKTVENLDFNAVTEQCGSIILHLDAYQKLPDRRLNVCQMPLVYEDEKAITDAVYKIFQIFSLNMELPEELEDHDEQSLDDCHNSYVTSYETKNIILSTFCKNLGNFFQEIKSLPDKSKQNAFVNTLTVLSDVIHKLALKEKEVYSQWKDGLPCPRCSSCTTCIDCTACTDCSICQYKDSSVPSKPRTDIRSLVWKTSIQIKALSESISDLSKSIVDNCCSNAFTILFTLPEDIIAIETLFQVFLKKSAGDEDLFAGSIQAIALDFNPLIEGMCELVRIRDSQRGEISNCLLHALIPPFTTIKASSTAIIQTLKQTLTNHAFEIPNLQKWSGYNNKCDGFEVNANQIAQSLTTLGNDFKTFAQKILDNKVSNLKIIPILSDWMAATQRLRTPIQNLFIQEGLNPLCVNCNCNKINNGIKSIEKAVQELLAGELWIKIAFSHQTCCRDLTNLLLGINDILSHIGQAVQEISQEANPDSLLRAVSIDTVASAVGSVAQQIGLIVEQRRKIEEPNELDPCHLHDLLSDITILKDILETQVLGSLSKASRLNANLAPSTLPSSCLALQQSVLTLSSTWELINTNITTICQRIQNDCSERLDRTLIAGARSLMENLQLMHNNLEDYLNAMSERNLCLPCQELEAESLKEAVRKLSTENKNSFSILSRLDAFLQNQCCFKIAIAFESCINQYGSFVKTFEALSTVQNFGHYLSTDASLIVFKNSMQSLGLKFTSLIQQGLTPFIEIFETHSKNAEIPSDVEENYIAHIESSTNSLKQSTDVLNEFLRQLQASPDLRTEKIQTTLNQFKNLKIRKNHHYINDVFHCMERHNLSLSNSLIRLSDIIFLSCEEAISEDYQSSLVLFVSYIQDIVLSLNKTIQQIPTAHMEKHNIEKTWEFEKFWGKLAENSMRLTSSIQAKFCCKDFCVSLKTIQQKFERASDNLTALSAGMNAVTTLDADAYKIHVQGFIKLLVALSSNVHELNEGLEQTDASFKKTIFLETLKTVLIPTAESLAQSTDKISLDLGIAASKDKAIVPPYSCEKMDFILRDFGQTISRFNNALTFFTNLAPCLLHQKFNIILEIVNIIDLPSAQFLFENALETISLSLDQNYFCLPRKLKDEKPFVFEAIHQFARNLSIVEEKMITSDLMVQASMRRQKLHALTTTTQPGGQPIPILQVLFSPVYDQRGFPVMNSEGHLVTSKNSFLEAIEKTKGNLLCFGHAVYGSKLEDLLSPPQS